jgi:hypothetical protein
MTVSEGLREWDGLLAANAEWWQTDGATSADNPFSQYDRDAIIGENCYKPDLIVSLNTRIITTDSQSGKSEVDPSIPHPGYVSFLEETGQVPVGLLRGLRCTEHQRPYLAGIAPREIWSTLLDGVTEFGIHINGRSGGSANDAFYAMMRADVDAVNLTKCIFVDGTGRIVHTVQPTNSWIRWDDWKRRVDGVHPDELTGLEQATIVGTEYSDDKGQMLSSVLRMLSDLT